MRPARPRCSRALRSRLRAPGTPYHRPAQRLGRPRPLLRGRRLPARSTPPAHTSGGGEGCRHPRAAFTEPGVPLPDPSFPALGHSPISPAGPRRPRAGWHRMDGNFTFHAREASVSLGAKRRLLSREVLEGGGGCYPDLGFRGAVAATGPASVPSGPPCLPRARTLAFSQACRRAKGATQSGVRAHSPPPTGPATPGPDTESKEEGVRHTNRLGFPRAASARGAGLGLQLQPTCSPACSLLT